MGQTGFFSRGSKLAGLGLTLLLAVGVAYAAQTQTVSVPSGDSYVAVAIFTPGSDDAAVGGNDNGLDNEWEWSVGVDQSGQLSINGNVVGSCIQTDSHKVTASAWKSGSQWFCDIEVVDLVTGQPVGGCSGHLLSGPTSSVTATAETLTSLTVN